MTLKTANYGHVSLHALPGDERSLSIFSVLTDEWNMLHRTLNAAWERLLADPKPVIVEELAKELATHYDEAISNDGLDSFVRDCQAHPIQTLLLADPYIDRAFRKPRGYAGDAVMLDYIYRPRELFADVVTKAIHHATTNSPNAQSILWRRDYIASVIRDIEAKNGSAQILSVASGHMRELDVVGPLGCALSITAVDQDVESIAECQRSYPNYNITPECESVVKLLGKKWDNRKFDLIYSAGLFDYLNDQLAARLIGRMTAMLTNGGRLVIGNFTKDSHGRGFMAGHMDWQLTYRDPDDLVALLGAGSDSDITRAFRDAPDCVAYLEVQKAA